MDVGMLHTHTLMVSLYLIQLGVKAGLLLAGNHERLDAFSNKVKVPSILVSVLMLATGIFLMFRSPEGLQPYIFVKFALVLASVPLGIIGFKRRSVALGVLSFLLTAAVMGLAFAKPAFLRNNSAKDVVAAEGVDMAVVNAGKLVYEQKCLLCHGADGAAGFQGAKNLQESVLEDAQITDLIRNGKGMMPADKDLSDQQVKEVVAYVKYLRK